MAKTKEELNNIKQELEILATKLQELNEDELKLVSGGNVFVTKSFDPQSHFENDTDNVIDIYQKIMGTKLELYVEEERQE